MKRLFVFLFMMISLPAILPAQEEARRQIYKSYQAEDMARWETILTDFGRKPGLSPSERRFYARNLYGYVGYLLSQDEEEKARLYLDQAWEQVDALLEKDAFRAEMTAMKSGLTGYEIALAPYKAPYLGFRSIHFVDKALDIDPQNPFAWMEKGNIAFFASFLNYGYGNATTYYQAAVDFFEQSGDTQYCWLYLNTLAQLGRSHEKSGNYKEAGRVYQKTLRIAPGFSWVRDELYPKWKAQG